MKIIIGAGIIVALSVFFVIQLTVFPTEFLSQTIVEPQPTRQK